VIYPSIRWLTFALVASQTLAGFATSQGRTHPPTPPVPPRTSAPGGGPQTGGSIEAPASEELGGPGTVLATRKISNETPGFPTYLDSIEEFGTAVTVLGDLDGDGVDELAVGVPNDDDNTPGLNYRQNGAVWILFLDADGAVRGFQKISGSEGGFHGRLVSPAFGSSVAGPGDLDGDGVCDLVVGAPEDDDTSPLAAFDSGAAWVLFLNADGTVRAEQKLARSAGGLADLSSKWRFGSALAAPGDLDGDGIGEVLVGVPFANTGATRAGEAWVLFLNRDGTVRAQQRIGNGLGGFADTLDADDRFGSSVASLGDLDGDGRPEVAVGALLDEEPGRAFTGGVWILSLNADGSVAAQSKLGEGLNGVSGLPDFGGFGSAIARIGDLDGDGVDELAVGASLEDDGRGGNFDYGAVWILFRRADGSVRAQTLVSRSQGGFPQLLSSSSHLGSAVAAAGDLNGDGIPDLHVGAPGDNEGGFLHGALWELFLGADGTVVGSRKIGEGHGFPTSLDGNDGFGTSVAALGDLDGNGAVDFAIGAPHDDGLGIDEGAVWVLFPRPDGTIERYHRIAEGEGGLVGPLRGSGFFGQSLAALGDLDGDGTVDLVVGQTNVPGPSSSGAGALWILFLHPDGTVREERQILAGDVGLRGGGFGSAVAPAGDVDGDGIVDLAVGVPGDSRGGLVVLLFLDRDGGFHGSQVITEGEGGFTGDLDPFDDTRFGTALAGLGDLDGDGIPDLAVGAPLDDDGEPGNRFDDRGALWILFLERTGFVRAHQKISALEGGLEQDVPQFERFLGRSVASLGDIDGDGLPDVASGAFNFSGGAVRILCLNADGTVRRERLIARRTGGFGQLENSDDFGIGIAAAGDVDGDGVMDLAVGAIGDDDGGDDHGAVWLLSLAGTARVDFETRADLVTPLENGRQLTGFAPFARAFDLESSGANRGAAIFDSTPLGPNDPSQDPDLLVGQGNVLILQDSYTPTQTVPGIFDHPNDDADGGMHRFAFHAPVQLRQLDLVDIDMGMREMSSVVLIDVLGHTRTYLVPPGFTGDRVLAATSGVRTLDLTTLDPQPGFASTATASEQPGFDPNLVLVLEVRIGGSGAVDGLLFEPRR